MLTELQSGRITHLLYALSRENKTAIKEEITGAAEGGEIVQGQATYKQGHIDDLMTSEDGTKLIKQLMEEEGGHIFMCGNMKVVGKVNQVLKDMCPNIDFAA